MRTRLALLLAGVGLLFAAVPASSHHAFAAEFDVNKPIKLTGAVTKVEWTNPHVWFYIDVKDDTGNVTNWGCEMGSPNGLMRAGWTARTLKIGEEVTVEGTAAKRGVSRANARVVQTSDGQRLFGLSTQPEQAPGGNQPGQGSR